jgi:hypothetical protein
MIPNPCIEVHTSPVDRPSVPPWFAEVVIIVQHLAAKGLLDAFAHQLRLVRGRFGTYEPLDFLALLLGYAISGERTLADFFERLAPFGSAFMALFGRKGLSHRATLSRFLADVDRPCLEAFRTLFEQQSFAEGWTAETIGGIFNRQGQRFLVFDVDATRQAARQRALPTAAELPPPRRRLDAVCAPGYTGRKRGEVVRTRITVLQMHTRQWIGTYSGKGNGDYRSELVSALRAITIYLKLFALTPEVALVRLDGQYGDAVAMAQLMKSGVYFLTRARGYQILEHPQIQRVLAYPPTASVTRVNSDEVVELFTLQEDGKLRCPAGASLWLSEVRQGNAFTQRAVYLAYQTDCQCCSLREQCLAKGAKGNRARRVSAVRRLLPTPAIVEQKPIVLGPIRLSSTWQVEHFAAPG